MRFGAILENQEGIIVCFKVHLLIQQILTESLPCVRSWFWCEETGMNKAATNLYLLGALIRAGAADSTR